MKKNITLNVSNPCSQNWENFKITTFGGFCTSCNKEVIDFTRMQDDEMINYITQSSPHICGRFYSYQLKAFKDSLQFNLQPGYKLLAAGLLCLLLSFVVKLGIAQSNEGISVISSKLNYPVTHSAIVQEHIVKGIVKSDEDNAPLAGVNIYLKGTSIGTFSDESGRFEFPQKLHTGDILIFSFIGLQTQELVITDAISEFVEIRMVYDTSIILGEVSVDDGSIIIPRKNKRVRKF